MKKSFLLVALTALSMSLCAQRSMEWYSYWGSNEAGSQIAPKAIVVDKDGSVYVAATFGGEKVAVESTTLVSASSVDNGDAVVVKMNANKQVQWTYNVVSAGKANVAGIALMSNGNIVVTGVFDNKINGADGDMALNDENMGEAAVYALVLDPSGKAVASWQIAALGAVAGAVSVDAQDNVILTGTLDGDATFIAGGNAEGDFENASQYYVAKYSKDGTPIWHKFMAEASNVGSFSEVKNAVDAEGNIYVSATLTGELTFASALIYAASANAVIMKYDAQGAEQWAHIMSGSRNDKAAGVAVNEPAGTVGLAVNHYSEDLQVDRKGDTLNNLSTKAGDPTQYHSMIVAFDKKDGAYEWFYDFGYSNTVDGGGALTYAFICTDEGVWYYGGNMSGRFGDSTTKIYHTTQNFGVTSIDGQNFNHNTNGGGDAWMVTLTRDGKLANVIRTGGTQTEQTLGIALTPDKKSIYLLYEYQVRDKQKWTCPDNMFDSYTDLSGNLDSIPSRASQYTILSVFCPENDGATETYSKAYKNAFASTMLAKYAFPELNVNELPAYTVGESYNQSILLNNPKGKKYFTMGVLVPDEFNFENGVLSATPAGPDAYEIGVLAVDSIDLPGKISYYANDKQTHPVRSNPRVLRYFTIRNSAVSGIDELVSEAVKQDKAVKIIRNGQLFIIRDGKEYNVLGF